MFFRKNEPDELMKKGAVHALGAYAYVITVALVFAGVESVFSGREEPGILAPISFLMLFVLSAAVMATLIFGTPVMLYVDGKKKEAVRLVGWTLCSLACLTFVAFAVMALMSR
jgi:hypothetical protein